MARFDTTEFDRKNGNNFKNLLIFGSDQNMAKHTLSMQSILTVPDESRTATRRNRNAVGKNKRADEKNAKFSIRKVSDSEIADGEQDEAEFDERH